MSETDWGHEAIKTTKLSNKRFINNQQETTLVQRSKTDSVHDGELHLGTRMHFKNASPLAHGSNPHPTSLCQFSWIGGAYLVMASHQVGIYRTW